MEANTRLEVRKRVAHVILNRPHKHNCFNGQTISELSEIFRSIELDPVIRAVVIESTGKSFSAGGDLEWMKKTRDYTEDENLNDARELANMLYKLHSLPKPTIAMVQGPAYGGGVGLIACCDIVIASERASFSLSEVKLGLTPATISPYVINAIGARQARRYFLTAERFSALTAKELGLIHEVCKETELKEKAKDIVSHLLGNGPEAIAAAKSLVFMAAPIINPNLLDKTARMIASQRVSPEGQEGLAAFFEKRPANWVTRIDSL